MTSRKSKKRAFCYGSRGVCVSVSGVNHAHTFNRTPAHHHHHHHRRPSMCVVLLRRTDVLDLITVDSFSVGKWEKLRPRKFIKAQFHIRGDASTPAPPTLIVVVTHCRSGSANTGMKIEGKKHQQDKFKQDAWVSFPVDDVSISKR